MTKIEIGANVNDHQEGWVMVDLHPGIGVEVLGDIRALPFRNITDIYCSHVLEHLPDPDIVLALKECRRVLVKAGKLEIYVPDLAWMMRRFLASSYPIRWSLWNKWIYGDSLLPGQAHHTGFSAQRLSDCLVAAGFREIKTRRKKRSIKLVTGKEHDARGMLFETGEVRETTKRVSRTTFQEIYALAYS